MPIRVAIVITTDGSADPASLVRDQDVWVVHTLANRANAEAVWSTRQSSGEYSLTTFEVDEEGAPDQWVANILGTIDTHHDLSGQWSSDDVVLSVHGSGATPIIRHTLAEFGRFEITESPAGFSANRVTS
jgi:hypothetical protein